MISLTFWLDNTRTIMRAVAVPRVGDIVNINCSTRCIVTSVAWCQTTDELIPVVYLNSKSIT